jgi:hypothetical protein
MLVVLLLGLLIGQVLLQYWESHATAWSWLQALLQSYRFASTTALLALSAALPLAALRLASRGFDHAPDSIPESLHWQRVTSLAPLLGAGYAAYQFGNIPGFHDLRMSLGGLADRGLPDPFLSLSVLPLIQALALAIGLALTITTLAKIWPADLTGRGIRWVRGQAFSLSAATIYTLVLLFVMVMRPQWMLI